MQAPLSGPCSSRPLLPPRAFTGHSIPHGRRIGVFSSGRAPISHSQSYSRDLSPSPRFVQHKNEAKAFYMFLSQVYDHIVNPGE